MKGFLVKNTRKDDLNMFADMANETGFETAEDVPLTILLPAFITSELKTAFRLVFYFSALLSDRYGDRFCSDVTGDDDAQPYAGLVAVQTVVICSCRWLGDDCWLSCCHLLCLTKLS